MKSRFTHKPSPAYQSAVEALRALTPFGDLSARAYADATAEAVLQMWEKSYAHVHLRQSPASVCIDRLLGKRCTAYSHSDHVCNPPGADHASIWNIDGKPAIYVMQPYGISWDHTSGIVDFCRERGLEAHIDARDSWHFPGCTVSVMICTPQVWRQLIDRPRKPADSEPAQ